MRTMYWHDQYFLIISLLSVRGLPRQRQEEQVENTRARTPGLFSAGKRELCAVGI